jgi:hypothetical protein
MRFAHLPCPTQNKRLSAVAHFPVTQGLIKLSLHGLILE